MVQFIIGILTGFLLWMTAVIVYSVLRYEKKHPEDEYWRYR